MQSYRLSLALLAVVLLAACQRQNEVQLTLIAQNATLQSEIEAVRQTATVDADRLQITVEYMGTRVGQAEENRAQLQATLSARGIDSSGVSGVPPQVNTAFPVPGATTENLAPAATPLAEQTLATAEITQPALVNFQMAPAVGSDDCAVNPTSNFSPSDAEIYIVATGVNIPAGTNIAARFSVGGQEINHDFTPDFAIDDACIWFFIDQADVEFRAGTWSVELELNGAPASPPIPFTITGGEAMTEGG
ncbi:MAG: hypothetical protein K8J31_00715 [Anaerolineae bacterium]|nr:hypothetical protein [Anaerolineae bacterium]